MWNYFDKVYCISLVQRPDRLVEAQRQFESAGLAGLVEFHLVAKHATNPEQGVYESHVACLSKALTAGAERILIFEDDILFCGFDPQVLQDGIDFMTKDTEWDLVFLGCMVKESRAARHRSVRRIRYRSLSHAYVVHRRLAERIVALPWHGMPYDDFLRDLKEVRTYVLYPSFAFQSSSRSDNERYLPLDRIRRLFGGLRRLQKGNERFHRHKTAIIAIHSAFAASILAWLIA